MVAPLAYAHADTGAYPTKCAEGRDLARVYRPSTKDWLPTHADDGSTCDHALDETSIGTAATRTLLQGLL